MNNRSKAEDRLKRAGHLTGSAAVAARLSKLDHLEAENHAQKVTIRKLSAELERLKARAK